MFSDAAGDVVNAVRGQNVQVAGGQLAQPPVPTSRAFPPSVTLQGRLVDPDSFSKIIIKSGDDGRVVRVGDVGRVELGAQDYTTNSYLSGKTAVAMLISQQPGTNALATAKHLQWPEVKVQAAVNYAKAFPEEIYEAMAENDAADFEELKRMLPQTTEFRTGRTAKR